MTATLNDVKEVYSGAEGRLWELIMGEQIHIGGLVSSRSLAETAGIRPGSSGVDLCCCTGAGMRFLLRFCGVGTMKGVDATPRMVELGRQRCVQEGFAREQSEIILNDACTTGLPDSSADFVWGEDAWCYVEDKNALIAEAARIVRKGGTVAFTDWLEGENMSLPERERFLAFMQFPNMETLEGYSELLREHGCEVAVARNTDLYAPCIDLYLQMLSMQLTYDALKIIGFDQPTFQGLAGEMAFVQQLAREGKVIQGMLVARKA